MATDYPIFDTSVYPPYKKQIDKLILFSLLPSVVLFELVATSIDKSTFQKYEAWRIALIKRDKLITPSANDWWETSKVIRNLYLRSEIQDSKIKTLRNDALIARMAIKNRGFVVTLDVDDYELIKKEMPDLKIKNADEFFA